MDIHRMNRIEAGTYVAWQYFGEAAALTLSPAAQGSEFREIFADNGADYFAVTADETLAAIIACEFPGGELQMRLLPAPLYFGEAQFAPALAAAALTFVRRQYRYGDEINVQVAQADQTLRQAFGASGQVVGSFVRMQPGD